jgi:CubicO group peptidase (beta-lactamase class C family)
MKRTELERVSPGAVGLSAAAIEAFVDELESGFTEPHGLMILRHGKVCAEGWWSPYAPGIRHGLQSLSKTYAATAVGIACTEGILRLNEPVSEIFPTEMPAEVSENLSKMTVRDVLCMGTGMETMPRPSADWIREFLATPVLHEPGSAFFYNSTGSTLLAAMVRRRSGETLKQYLTTRLFDKIGIDADNLYFATMPDGTEVGGGGLLATTEDNLRLMLLYHNGGVWAGERILSTEYVRLATSKQIDTASEEVGNPPALDNFVGYGFQIWMCRHPGCYRADGAFGQYSIVHPKLDMIVSINETAGSAHWAQKTLDCVWRFFEQLESEPFVADDAADARLAARMRRLSLPKPAYQPHGARDQFTGSFATSGGKLVFGEATGSLMGGSPLPPEVAGCTISFSDVLCELKLRFADKREQTYQIALDGSRRENAYNFEGAPMTRVLLSGYFVTTETLVFSARFVETCYEQEYCLALSGNTLTFTRRGTNASFAFLANLVPSECVMERV